MKKIAQKMPVTVILLGFSYLMAACGIGVGCSWMIFRFKDPGYFIYGFLILAGSFLLAALVRMFADLGQIAFDNRVDAQNSFRQVNQLGQDLKTQLQLQADTLNKNLLNIVQVLEQSSRNLLNIVQTLDQSSQETRKLGQDKSQDLKTQLQLQADTLNQSLVAIKNNFDQMNCDSKDMNQNIHQIRTFFEQIERHLDLKK